MKIIAINGSPRKNWNTARLLEAALDGAWRGNQAVSFVLLLFLRM